MRLIACLIICCMKILSFAHPNEANYNDNVSNETHTAESAVQHSSQTSTSHRELKTDGTELEFPTNILVKTDKEFYKPDDEIFFEVVFLDENYTEVEPDKNAIIWFEDGNSTKIKEIKGFTAVDGVYTGSLKTPESSAVGDWSLRVLNSDYFGRKDFVVNKYAVIVEAAHKVYVTDGDLQVVVKANYTDGDPMDGNVTVALYLKSFPDEHHTVVKTGDMIKGIAKIDFNVKEYEDYIFCPYIDFTLLLIEATVEEQLTGGKASANTLIFIYSFCYEAKCLNPEGCDPKKGNTETDVIFQILNSNGTRINDTISTVELTYEEKLVEEEGYDNQKPPVAENELARLTFNEHLNENAIVHFKVKLPDLPVYDGFSHFYLPTLKYMNETVNIVT